MSWTKLVGVVLLPAALSSCAQQGPSAAEANAKVAALNTALAEAETRINALEGANRIRAITENSEGKAYLDPTSDGYSLAKTDVGALLVSFQSSAPKADGTEVTFRVGNPTAASLVGVKFHVEYNVRQGDDPNWADSIKSTDYTAVEPLYSGSWSLVRVPLPAIKPDQLGFLAVTLKTNEIRLNQPYR
jgi:hypothetical protein